MKNGVGKLIAGVVILYTSNLFFAYVPLLSFFAPTAGLVLIIWGIVNLFSKDGATPNRQVEEFGEGYKYCHFFDGTAIAVDPGKREVKLRTTIPKRGVVEKIYPMSSIRNVSTNVQTGGHMYGVGMSAGSVAIGHNIRVNRENKLASGIFLDVKDIEHPKWRIAFGMKDQVQQQRWYEIIQQALDGELT